MQILIRLLTWLLAPRQIARGQRGTMIVTWGADMTQAEKRKQYRTAEDALRGRAGK